MRCFPIACGLLIFVAATALAAEPKPRKTEVAIKDEAFLVNGKPTYEGRSWQGKKVEGLSIPTGELGSKQRPQSRFFSE